VAAVVLKMQTHVGAPMIPEMRPPVDLVVTAVNLYFFQIKKPRQMRGFFICLLLIL